MHFFNKLHYAKHWIYKCTSKAAIWNRWVTVYKVCYRWKISTNTLPHHTLIKTLHKIQIIFSCFIVLFLKKTFLQLFLQQRTLILYRNALHILKIHTSLQSFPFHEGKNLQVLPYSARCVQIQKITYLSPYLYEHKPSHKARVCGSLNQLLYHKWW